jgi:hypothetical protein
MTRLTSLIFTASLLVACGPTRPLDEGTPCPCAPGWSCDATTNLCVSIIGGTSGTTGTAGGGSSGSDGGPASTGTGGSGPTRFTAAQVQSALANCDLPHGPAVTINNSDDVKARVAGTWLLCPASAVGEPHTMFAPGIQFEPDGRFEVLAPTADGGLQTNVGVLSQGQWSTFCEISSTITGADSCPGIGYYGPLVRIQVVAGDESPAGCFVGPVSFESSPTRAYVVDWPQEYCSASYTGDPFSFWLVPLR